MALLVGVLYASCLGYSCYVAFAWRLNKMVFVSQFFIITEHGIEFRKGILSRHVMRASYQSVSNVFVRQSLLQRIFKFGDVDIDTAGGPEPEIVLHNFQKAGRIEEMIESHSRKARQANMQRK
jgi:uncharacterized membrane protein YdbT with pleckstrin-like domain